MSVASVRWTAVKRPVDGMLQAPDFGREVRVCDPVLYGTAEAVPLYLARHGGRGGGMTTGVGLRSYFWSCRR